MSEETRRYFFELGQASATPNPQRAEEVRRIAQVGLKILAGRHSESEHSLVG